MSSEIENPFADYGKIATGSRFIGRKRSIITIEERLFNPEKPGNMAIVGMPLVGKTSLIYQAIMTRKEELIAKRFLPILINLAFYSEPSHFFPSLIAQCREELESLDWLTPTVAREANRVIQSDSSVSLYQDIQRFFLKLQQECIRIIFILDEFDYAKYLFKGNDMAFGWIRDIPSFLQNVAFVTVSNRSFLDIVPHKRDGISTYTSSFDIHYLKPFEEDDIQEYVDRLAAIGIPITSVLREKIDFYCGGQPYLLEVLGASLIRQFRNKHSADLTLAAQSINQVFVDYATTLSDLLARDDWLAKLSQIVFGPVVDVQREDIEMLLKYGIIKPNPKALLGRNGAYVAFSEFIQSCLTPIEGKGDIWLLIYDTERALRRLISAEMRKKYGEKWLSEIEHIYPRLFKHWREKLQNVYMSDRNVSENLLNSLPLKDIFDIIFADWSTYRSIFQVQPYKDSAYWRQRAEDVLRMRNPLSHSGTNDALKYERLAAQEAYKEILEAIRTYEFVEFSFIPLVELTTSSIENGLERLREAEHTLLSDIDRQRTRQLQTIFVAALDLCRQETLRGQKRFCTRIDTLCKELLREIKEEPTKVSVEGMIPIIESMQIKTRQRVEEIYNGSPPQLTIRPARELYVPDGNQKIEVQVVVKNGMGCSPAEELRLMVEDDERFFTPINDQPTKLGKSLSEGERQILLVPLQVTQKALDLQGFSLSVYAQYGTSSAKIVSSAPISMSIQLDTPEQFEEIENPYATNAYGAAVKDPRMFYGRSALIDTIAKTILRTHLQTKEILIYGQKRSGKSSILFHLKKKLEQQENLLVIDMGNIGALLDGGSDTPLLYQILWSIISGLRMAIRTEERRGRDPLGLSFPTRREFENDKMPLVFFKELFTTFQEYAAQTEEWKDVRVVLLIDEFSYIHSFIVTGQLNRTFMQNWKAILQANFFHLVLAGQDVMPRFIQRFANEFGAIQPIRVSSLKEEDAIRLIDEPIRFGGKLGKTRYHEHAIERILELTDGNPFYIQIICHHLVEYMNNNYVEVVTEIDIDKVIHDLVYGINRLSLYNFDNLISSGDVFSDAISEDDVKKVLTQIALHTHSGSCSRDSIVCKTQAPIENILKDLEEREVIKCEDAHYYSIRVGLFKEWLIAHPQQ